MGAPVVNPIPNNDQRSEDIILKYVGSIFDIKDNGEIWRVAERISGSDLTRICSPRRAEYKSKDGYLRIRISINGINVRASAHRVVYRFIVGDIPENMIINHEDCCRSNNHPDNLKPLTQSENIHHGGRWSYRK